MNDDTSVDNNLVVLDPDHPLMQRFQKTLYKTLVQRDEKLTLEAREAKYQLEVYFIKLKIQFHDLNLIKILENKTRKRRMWC